MTRARYEDTLPCDMEPNHTVPCNGFVTPECVGLRSERRVSSPVTRALKDHLTSEAMNVESERDGFHSECQTCQAEQYACLEKHRVLPGTPPPGAKPTPKAMQAGGEFGHCVEPTHLGTHREEPFCDQWMPQGMPRAAETFSKEVSLKDSNPKDAIGVQKLPLSLVPQVTIAYGALAHLNGALKYGKWNWRSAGVRASVYLDGVRRHLAKWEDGEELDEDGVPHLGSVIAGVGILLDARAAGKLNDDRPPSIGVSKHFDDLTPLVKALLEKHKGKTPRHYTIADTEKKP